MDHEDNHFTVNDFTEDFSGFSLNKPCMVLNKIFMERPIVIHVHNEKLNIQNHILEINNYFKWLNNCKDELLVSFCEIVNSWTEKNIMIDEIIKSNWYEELIIPYVMIYLSSSGIIGSRMYCKDKYDNRIEIYFKNNFININYSTEEDYLRQYLNIKENKKEKNNI